MCKTVGLAPREITTMRKPSLGIAPEGVSFITLCVVTTFMFAVLGCWFMAFLNLILTWFSAFFFRDPERVIPSEPDVAVSPADGCVIRIEKRLNPFGEGKRMCISIFMNLFSVHVNRSPVAGKVEQLVYKPGKFFSADLDKASRENEQCAWEIVDEKGEHWGMVQIAGLIARRIVARAEKGDVLARGERYGLIRFGSRVDLYLPESYTPSVRLGDEVRAGETVIAALSQE